MFGDADGGSFLTESLRSSGSKTEDSPKVTKPSVFNGKDDEDEDDVFGSSISK
jgi:hypothetical protein